MCYRFARAEGFHMVVAHSNLFSSMSKVNSTWSDSPFSNSFSYVSLVFVSCSANEVAHLLARSGELATCLIYQHIPGTIQELVNSEKMFESKK
jgi:hypothetical protein